MAKFTIAALAVHTSPSGKHFVRCTSTPVEDPAFAALGIQGKLTTAQAYAEFASPEAAAAAIAPMQANLAKLSIECKEGETLGNVVLA